MFTGFVHGPSHTVWGDARLFKKKNYPTLIICLACTGCGPVQPHCSISAGVGLFDLIYELDPQWKECPTIHEKKSELIQKTPKEKKKNCSGST